jgi:diacylglycerol kinase family enzyme/membrane-associated phospholipid phosphatase
MGATSSHPVSVSPSRPAHVATSGWGGVQRRLRRLVPVPIRRADLALFRAAARSELPVLGPALPRLSRAANQSRLWMAVAAGLAFAAGRFGRRAALRGLLAIAATSAVTNLPAKLLAGRERPDLSVVPEVRRLARVPASTSFPSGHSASALAFATAASLELPRARVPLLALASAVAYSRVYTGVHYPGDVLVGGAIGVLIARATTRTWPLADDTPATATPAGLEAPRAEADGTGLVLVANADAGHPLGDDPVELVRTALPGIEIVGVEAGSHLPDVLRAAAARARALGVAGGDGSASAGADAAAEAGIPLLVVPAGTLNHLAKDVGIDGVAAAIEAVRGRQVVVADVGELDGHTFVNAASVGVYPHLVATRERWEQTVGKWPAALAALVRVLATRDPFELEIDGRRRRVWFLFFGNNQFTEEGLAPSRRRRLDDGTLDIRIVDADVAFARSRLLFALLLGRVERSAAYERRVADEVHVRSLAGPLRLAGDGETWEQGTQEMTVRKRRAALLLLQP